MQYFSFLENTCPLNEEEGIDVFMKTLSVIIGGHKN